MCVICYSKMFIIHKKINEIICKRTTDSFELLNDVDFTYLLENNRKIWNMIAHRKKYFITAANDVILKNQNVCDYCNKDITFVDLFEFHDYSTHLLCYGLGFFCDECFNSHIEHLECGGNNNIHTIARIERTNNWIMFNDYQDLPSTSNSCEIDKSKFFSKKIAIESDSMDTIYGYFYDNFLDDYKEKFLQCIENSEYIENLY